MVTDRPIAADYRNFEDLVADAWWRKETPMMLINRTGQDIGYIERFVRLAMLDGGKLPEELADLFTLTEVAPGRWALDFI